MRRSLLATTLSVLCLTAMAASQPVPLHDRSFEDILRYYFFVADFSTKEPERAVSGELFWRYPYQIPRVRFPVKVDLDDPSIELPQTQGEGMPMFHLNGGRAAFLDGDIDRAKSMWLAGRSRFGTNFDYHRRNDYFIGLSFLKLARADAKNDPLGELGDRPKAIFSNATTFLSSAFILKDSIADPLLDQVATKQLYNLAAIYYNYERYAAAYGAADHGLNILRRTGRLDFRPELNRILAESFIQNRSYLEAVQLFDDALRQEPTRSEAAAIFNRVGDIYFDLNNYELAESNYALASRIHHELEEVVPAQFIMRGEALFWLGRFSEAQQMIDFGLRMNTSSRTIIPLSDEYVAYAHLRLADAYFARGETEVAKLAYFKVQQDFRRFEAGRIAKIRQSCLELPQFDGKNVMHARGLLEDAKRQDIPAAAREIAWACHVASFSERERTKSMVDRVREFYKQYPDSRFLAQLIEPVREVQAGLIKEYFAAGDQAGATRFFEAKRNLLYKDIDDSLQQQLFTAYVDTNQVEKALEFWPAFRKLSPSPLHLVREAVFIAELYDLKKTPTWQSHNKNQVEKLEGETWETTSSPQLDHYVMRIQTTSTADQHLYWIYKLIDQQTTNNEAAQCNRLFPTLIRLHDLDATPVARRNELTKAATRHIDRLTGTQTRRDEACILTMLEFEVRILRDQPDLLSQRYQQRLGWPLTARTADLFWAVSEILRQQGDSATARRMWQTIVDKAPPRTSAIQFARSRLDTRRTEFERLWD